MDKCEDGANMKEFGDRKLGWTRDKELTKIAKRSFSFHSTFFLFI